MTVLNHNSYNSTMKNARYEYTEHVHVCVCLVHLGHGSMSCPTWPWVVEWMPMWWQHQLAFTCVPLCQPRPTHTLGAEYRWRQLEPCYQHTREGRLLSKQRNGKSVKYMTSTAYYIICHVFSIVKALIWEITRQSSF